MRIQIEEQAVVGILESQHILFLITQDRDGQAMDVVTETAMQVLIGECRLHDIDSRHEACFLINRIAVDDDVLDCRAQFYAAAGLEPCGNTSVVQIVQRHALVVQQQRNQFVHVVGHEVALGVNDETVVFQQR